jgi:PKD repeat protein
VTFTNTSAFASNYSWNFGDGSTSTLTDANHTYTTPGNYDVWLSVMDSAGTVIDSLKQTIQVFATPVAIMNITRRENTVMFANNSTDASSYIWKFGSFTSFEKTPDSLSLKDLQDSGIVKFTLIAFSTGGCTDTTETTIDIWNTGVAENAGRPFTGIVYPNPLETYSILSFSTTQAEKVAVEVYNVLGAKVATIENRELTAGTHEYMLAEHMFPAKGVYIIRISSESQNGHIRVLNNR